MKRGLVAIVGVLFLSACATTENYRRKVDSWVGHNSEELVGSWGYPTRTFTAPDGNTVLAYERSATYVANYQAPSVTTGNAYGNSGAATNWGGTSYAVPVTNYCNTYFETDSAKTIVRWQAQGNSCTSD